MNPGWDRRSNYYISAACCLLMCLPAWAVDRTIAGVVDKPLEISLPPSTVLSQWVVRDYPSQILEIVTVRRLPAETVFLFRPLKAGTGVVRLAHKEIATESVTEYHEVEVIITEGKSRAAAGPPAEPGNPGAAGEPMPLDDLVMAMIEGRLGFPAKNPTPQSGLDSALFMRRLYPLPYSATYIFPPGSFLLNPLHRLPLPDTPPGLDTPPAAYHQALQLAKRGLIKPAADVLEGLIKDQKARKARNPIVESYYEFMKGHLRMSAENYPDAVKTFEALYPDKEFGVGSRFYGALAKEYSGDTIGAISGYQGVISHNPEGYFTPEAAWRIARMFYNARAFGRAIQEYTEFLQVYPKSPFIDDVLMDLAKIYDQVYVHQNFDIAIKLYDTLLTNFADSPYADTAQARKKFIMENYF